MRNHAIDRRRFLAAATGLPVASLLRAQPPASPGRIERVHSPQNLETNFAGLSDVITPNELFYVRNQLSPQCYFIGRKHRCCRNIFIRHSHPESPKYEKECGDC